jgi:hypothetical protein
MRSDDKLVQIVITRKSEDTFRVVTFTEGVCDDARSMDERATGEFVRDAMKQLKAVPGLDA